MSDLKKIAIAIDERKRDIFDRRLTAAGFTYEQHRGVDPGTLLLILHVADLSALATVVLDANTEAAAVRMNRAVPPQ